MDRKLLKYVDWPLILAVVVVSVLSLFTIASASKVNDTGDPLYYAKKQLVFMAAGFFVLIVSLFIDYGRLETLGKPLYVLNLLMVGSVLVLGRSSHGAQRWIQLGFFSLQPSEFAKVFIIMGLAIWLSKRGTVTTYKDLAFSLLYVGVPMGLILLQPDLGTSLVFIFVYVVMLFVSGISFKYLAELTLAGLAALPVVWKYGLADYQRKRLIIFTNPYIDPTVDGYHIIQSMIAIGSGGFWGKGYGMGTQNQLQFLPEQHTDFIFSVVGEELGFIVGAILLLAYFFIIYRCIQVAVHSKDMLGTLIASGVAAMLLFQVLVNAGMTMGIMPLTGIPLPWMSAGGSSYLANMMGLALVINVGMRRHRILF
jgi:rod shape determining protein RodA